MNGLLRAPRWAPRTAWLLPSMLFVVSAATADPSGIPEALARPAGQRGQDRILSEIRQIQSQLAVLAETQEGLSRAVEALLEERSEQIAADRRSRAETRNALDRMERNVSTLSEAFRETNDRLSELMVEVESVREAQRRAALAGVPAAGSDEADPGEAPPAEADGAGSETPAGGEDEATLLDEPGIAETYLEADADRLQGRYELAISGFERVIEFGGELADNARYGIGDSLLAQERLEAALEQFEMLIRDFPDSNKIGEAWFQKGIILGRLGHESDAREIFEDILEVYAGTPAARAAKRQLDAMPPENPGA